jgi:hypothetical protein
MAEIKWIAVDEVGNDNFATSIYENDYHGLLIARCNQNGQYPWQAAAIICGLEQNKLGDFDGIARDGVEAQRGLNDVWPGDPYP